MTMLRVSLVVVLVLVTSGAEAAEWAEQLLLESDHDFGTVAPGSDVSHRFPLKNCFKNRVRLISVRSSCGCTTPSLAVDSGDLVLSTNDTGHVLAKFNTRAFTGRRSATITLVAEFLSDDGKWHRDEAQLRVRGNIRTDLKFSPATLQFPSIYRGTEQTAKARVTKHRRPSWRILQIETDSDWLKVESSPRQVKDSDVSYSLNIRITRQAPVGHFRERIVLVTNDSKSVREVYYVVGQVLPEVSVTPGLLRFTRVPQGGNRSRRIVLRGNAPFRVLGADCQNACLSFEYTDQRQDTHIVEVRFLADCSATCFEEIVIFRTDSPVQQAVELRVAVEVVADP